MGYSVFIIAKSRLLMDRMHAFMSANMSCINEHFFGVPDFGFGLRVGPDGHYGVSYKGGRKNKLMIGFDYNCAGGEKSHMMEMLEWMGRKIGREPGTYYYDGEKTKTTGVSLKVRIDNGVKELKEHYRKNKEKKSDDDVKYSVAFFHLGCMVHIKPRRDIDTQIKRVTDFIDGDIKRLDELWDKLK